MSGLDNRATIVRKFRHLYFDLGGLNKSQKPCSQNLLLMSDFSSFFSKRSTQPLSLVLYT